MEGKKTISKITDVGIRREERDSNFELLRIILMLLIIAHHYTVNSGLTSRFSYDNISANMLFLQFFGMFGKMAINAFTLITGYFMVTSRVSIKKFLQMYLEVKFYYLVSYLFFCVCGYESFSVKTFIKTVLNVVYEAGRLYTGTYICFFVFIPIINVLVKAMKKSQYEYLLIGLITYFTVFSTVFKMDTFNFLGWLITVYLIGGYIRLYQPKGSASFKIGLVGTIINVILMYGSVLVADYIKTPYYYHMLSDSNKLLALTCSIFLFLMFKNMKVRKNKIINGMAASTWGILLIHTNSEAMRRFIWQTIFKNVEFYESPLLMVHAVIATLLVYVVCLFIDMVRIKYIEPPFSNWFFGTSVFIKINEKMEKIL